MLELNIKAQLLPGAEAEMIGIKDAIAYIVEPWAVKLEFKIDDSAPQQLTLTDKPYERPLREDEMRKLIDAIVPASKRALVNAIKQGII